MKVINQNGEIVSVDTRSSYLVLDFWHTACAACFREFPALQNVSERFSETDNINVMAINIPISVDSNYHKAFNMLFERQYTFENFVAVDRLIYKKLGVKKFPTALLIDKEGNIIFRGTISDVEVKIEEILQP